MFIRLPRRSVTPARRALESMPEDMAVYKGITSVCKTIFAIVGGLSGCRLWWLGEADSLTNLWWKFSHPA